MKIHNTRFGIATRPVVGETICGDQVAVAETADRIVVIVADGVGHGPLAAAAASAAIHCARESRATDPAQVLLECDRELSRSRGAAVAVLWITHNQSEIAFAGVGNIAVTGVTADPMRLISVPGIVGARVRKVLGLRQRIQTGDFLIVHTDGISRRFDAERYRSIEPQSAADRLLEEHGLPHDDATCVVMQF